MRTAGRSLTYGSPAPKNESAPGVTIASPPAPCQSQPCPGATRGDRATLRTPTLDCGSPSVIVLSRVRSPKMERRRPERRCGEAATPGAKNPFCLQALDMISAGTRQSPGRRDTMRVPPPFAGAVPCALCYYVVKACCQSVTQGQRGLMAAMPAFGEGVDGER